MQVQTNVLGLSTVIGYVVLIWKHHVTTIFLFSATACQLLKRMDQTSKSKFYKTYSINQD